MHHRTDQTGAQPTPTNEATLRALLTAMAARLTTEDPAGPMTERARLDLVRELTDGKEAPHADLLCRSVAVAPNASRAEYAEVLLAVADTLDLLHRYKVAVERGRAIAAEVGAHYDEDPAWRSNEHAVAELWSKAQDAGHTVSSLMAASKAEAA